MVKRDVRCILSIVSLMLLFTSCSGQDTNGPQPNIHQRIQIEGSNALQPFVSAIAPLFGKQYQQVTAKVKGGGSNIQPIADIQVQGGGSLTGLDAMTEQKADISMTNIYADPATYSSPDLTDQIVVVIPYALIVHRDLDAIQSLTAQQIAGIFSTHTIRNWKEVGGPDLPIVPISEKVHINPRGNTNFFQTSVLSGNPEVGTPIDETSPTSVRDTVANTPGAIGYTAVPLLDESVRIIAIDRLMPTADNIESNRYHFWVYGHLYTLKYNNSGISSFLNFAVSPAAQQVAKTLRYIPLENMKILT
jgi:phosphate transport system substrate-binding protein